MTDCIHSTPADLSPEPRQRWRIFTSIRSRILLPLAVTLTLLAAAIIGMTVASTRSRIDQESAEEFGRLQEALCGALAEEAEMLDAALEAVSQNQAIEQAYLDGDHDRLQSLMTPLFTFLRENQYITDLDVVDPSGVTVLSVRRPEAPAEREMFVLRGAQQSGQMAWGTTVNRLGSYTLRVARPWYGSNGDLIGYMELGQDIDHVTRRLSEHMGIGLLITVRKDLVDRDQWEATMASLGRDADWELHPSLVLVDQIMPELPVRVIDQLGDGSGNNVNGSDVQVHIGDEDHHVAFQPLVDAAGNTVGELVATRSIAAESKQLLAATWRISVVCVMVGGGIIGFFYVVLGKIQRRLRDQSKKLVRSEQFLQTVIDTVPDSLRVLDMDRRIVLANQATRDMTPGIDPIGMACYELSHHRNEPCQSGSDTCPFRSAAELLDVLTMVHTHLNDQGEERFVEISAAPILDESGQPVQIVESSRDVTARVRSEEDLAAAIERANLMTAEAEIANAAKSDFLANMSHEIRTPMTAILGFAEQLKHPDLSSTDRDEFVEIIERNGRNLLELINDILDLSKIEAGKFSMEILPTDVTNVIADVASTMRVRAAAKGLDLRVEYMTELPETIQTDPARIRQSLVNLVGNSIKFTEQGEVCIGVTFLSRWVDDQPAVELRVADTGVGMDRATMDRLFAPFVQADASTSRKFGGTGLGLTITRNIIEMLGGEISVDSHIDEGSVFTITIPTGSLDGVAMIAEPQEIECTPASVSTDFKGEKPLAGYCILLAEDGYDNQVLLGAVLRKAGATVDIAENGLEAVNRVADSPDVYDAILMDMQMPKMDGYQATRVLRQKGHDCPIIALTAHAMAGDREKCIDAGCTDYCTKPIDKIKLVRAITRHATRRPPQHRAAEHIDAIASEYADDPDMADIISAFVARLPETIATMRTLLANDDRPELQRQAHQLKGAGGGYGYPAVTEAAKALEAAVKADDMAAAGPALDALDAICQAAVQGQTTDSLVTKEMGA